MAEQIYNLVISSNIAGQFAQNITHWRFDDSGFNSTHEAAGGLLASFNTNRLATLKSVLPTTTTLLSFKSRRVTNGQGFENTLNLAAGTVGTRTGNVSAAAISPVFIGYPALPIGRERARFFAPGVTDTDLVLGIYQSGYSAAVDSALNTLFDPLTVTGGGGPTATFVLKHEIPANAIPIVRWLMSATVGTLRRRQLPV